MHIGAPGLCERTRGGMESRGPREKNYELSNMVIFGYFLAVLAIFRYFPMYSEVERALNYRILQYGLQGT